MEREGDEDGDEKKGLGFLRTGVQGTEMMTLTSIFPHHLDQQGRGGCETRKREVARECAVTNLSNLSMI